MAFLSHVERIGRTQKLTLDNEDGRMSGCSPRRCVVVIAGSSHIFSPTPSPAQTSDLTSLPGDAMNSYASYNNTLYGRRYACVATSHDACHRRSTTWTRLLSSSRRLGDDLSLPA
jgi:hypothetical protein